jgi:NAD(P)-dependent dehydrogenase (short-subunit alcohol dehydrogenase family)
MPVTEIDMDVARHGPQPLWAGIPEAEREAYHDHVATTNLTRTISHPDQIAPSYAFITDQPFATGAVLVVDGGRLLV